eukprot:scaffold27521_cov30-Tisochrysis_lutea.AAC.2
MLWRHRLHNVYACALHVCPGLLFHWSLERLFKMYREFATAGAPKSPRTQPYTDLVCASRLGCDGRHQIPAYVEPRTWRHQFRVTSFSGREMRVDMRAFFSLSSSHEMHRAAKTCAHGSEYIVRVCAACAMCVAAGVLWRLWEKL